MRRLGGAIIVVLLAACSPRPDALQADSVAAATTPPAQASAPSPVSSAGIWSATGILLRDRPVASPDGRFTLAWTDEGIAVSGASHGLLALPAMGEPPPEILWSPHGAYVAITWSDDSVIPVWTVEAYYLGEPTPRPVGVAEALGPLGQPLGGMDGTRPSPNVSAVAWLDDERTLLLAIEQPKDGSWMHGAVLGGVKLSMSDVTVGDGLDSGASLVASYPSLGPRLLRDFESQPPSSPE